MELWGIFGIAHLVSLPVAAGIIIGLYFLLKNKSEKTQRIVLGILSLSGISAIIFNLVQWNSPLEYLPFHLCSINAVLLPIAILTKNKTIGNLLSVWCIGALAAIALNFYPAAWSDLYSNPVHLFFYFPHLLEFGIPILLFKFGIIKLDYKFIPRTLILTLGIYTAVHFINLGVIEYATAKNLVDWAGNPLNINYMYSIHPEGFPILTQFYDLIPHSYWYMLLVFPIIAVYLLILFLPALIKTRKNKTRNGLQE